MSFKRKPGNKIQREGGMVCEIMLISDTQIVVKATDCKLYILSASQWHMYADVPTFYRLGKKYKFANRDTVWKVMDLYYVGGKSSAIAKKIEPWGEVDVERLARGDFARMVEVS